MFGVRPFYNYSNRKEKYSSTRRKERKIKTNLLFYNSYKKVEQRTPNYFPFIFKPQKRKKKKKEKIVFCKILHKGGVKISGN